MVAQPYVSDPEKTGLILDAIHDRLEANKKAFTAIGVRYGTTGLCLYHFARALYLDRPEDAERGAAVLEHTFELLNAGYVSERLFHEMAEIGWAIETLKAAGIYDIDTNEVLNDFDELLLPRLEEAMEAGNFDPAIGAVSFGNYFVARMRSNPDLEPVVARLCDQLVHHSHLAPEGRYWKSKLMNDDSVYIGLSHGIAGLNLFLIHAGKALGRDYRKLVSESCRFIVHSELKGEPVFFPVVHGKSNDAPIYANNWCYGDPGTLYGLMACAKYTGDEELEKFAQHRLRSCAFRERNETYLVAGYALLYGYAGLAMLYDNLASMTGQEFLNEAKRMIIERITGAFDPTDAYLGFRGYWNQEAAVTNYSFSEGMAGIAMLLMAETRPEIRQLYHPFYFIWP